MCFLFCTILYIPHIRGDGLTTQSGDTHKKPLDVTHVATEYHATGLNNTKLTLISTEGGSVGSELPIATLLEDNHSELINLDKEIGKAKVSPIVPRKGVDNIPVEDNVIRKNTTKERIDTTITASKTLYKNVSMKTTELSQTKQTTKSDLPMSTKETEDKKTSLHVELQTPKKPPVLSAEAILETDRRMHNAQVGASSKPIVSDQLPSPNVKYQKLSPSSHPGMVMPIVITMLVVPMFAVLGYMALRRGQEAWKNRHYKRMDFLLDGMYND